MTDDLKNHPGRWIENQNKGSLVEQICSSSASHLASQMTGNIRSAGPPRCPNPRARVSTPESSQHVFRVNIQAIRSMEEMTPPKRPETWSSIAFAGRKYDHPPRTAEQLKRDREALEEYRKRVERK